MKMDKDYRPIVKAAKRQGWQLDLTGGHHPRLVPPDGWKNSEGDLAAAVTFAATPSDTRRGIKNFKADLKRQGLDL